MSEKKDKGLDLLLLTIPPVTNRSAPLGPSIVISQAINDGFNAEHYDLNTELFKSNRHNPQAMDWFFNDYMYEDNISFQNYFEKYIKEHVPKWLKTISQKKPKYLGFSVLSYRSWKFTIHFLENYGHSLSDCKIIIGGGFIRERIDAILRSNKRKLFDFICQGEGEVVISEILKGKTNIPGVNGNPQLIPFDLNKMPFPNFNGLNLDDYGYGSTRESALYMKRNFKNQIEASRGCIRKCRFCTVPQSQKGYRFKEGQLVAKEMINTYHKTGEPWFQFVDSLINGSIKQLNNLCNSLIEKKSAGNFDLYWGGYFIIRPKKLFPEKYFKQMFEAGCRKITMAIESGSQEVRDHMRKLVKTEDIFYNLEQAKIWNMNVEVLFMVGYPTETEANFVETLELLTKLKPYRDIIQAIKCSWRVGVSNHNSQLNHEFEDLGLQVDSHGEWFSDSVNLEISAQRYFRFKKHASDLGLNFKQKVSDEIIKEKMKQLKVKEASLLTSAN